MIKKSFYSIFLLFIFFSSIVFASDQSRQINVDGFTLNDALSKSFGIDIYGDPSFITNNTFKGASRVYQDGKWNEIKNVGHYQSSSTNQRGEFRYHGFDREGNKISNSYFPYDVDSGRDPQDKRWVYHPWAQSIPYAPKIPSAYYEYIKDHQNEESIVLQNIITKGMPFSIQYTTHADMAAFHYAHIQAAPTTRTSGSIQMHHIGQDHQYYYQTFRLGKIKSKIMTPVKANIDILHVDDTNHQMKTYTIRLTSTLLDQTYYQADHPIRSSHYHREDIEKWVFIFHNKTYEAVRTLGNSACAEVTLSLPSHVIPHFHLEAVCHFYTKETSSGYDQKEGVATVEVTPVRPPEINITAVREMLDTQKFQLIDQTLAEKTVWINDRKLSPTEQAKFLTGNYLFPLCGDTKLYQYQIDYANDSGHYTYVDYVIVYTTKPRVNVTISGHFKANRAIHATLDFSSTNSSYLQNKATFHVKKFTSDSPFQRATSQHISFLKKQPGVCHVDTQGFLSLPSYLIQRHDVPPTYHEIHKRQPLYVMNDLPPAIDINLWTPCIGRNEMLDAEIDVTSIDGDSLASKQINVLNEQGEVVFSGNPCEFTPITLGIYHLVVQATEKIDPSSTLPEFLDSDAAQCQKRSLTIHVVNYAPVHQIYLASPNPLPAFDLMVVSKRENDTKYFTTHQIDHVNTLSKTGAVINWNHWDYAFHTHKVKASDQYHSGQQLPPSHIPYHTGDYHGTLFLHHKINQPKTIEDGYYTTKTLSKAVEIHQHNYAPKVAEYTFENGEWFVSQSWETVLLPDSMPYHEDGWHGTIYKTSAVDLCDPEPPASGKPSPYYRVGHWLASYTGIVHKTSKVYVPHHTTIDQYTGYYEGIVSRTSQQEFQAHRTLKNHPVALLINLSKEDATDVLSKIHKQTDVTSIGAYEKGVSSEVSKCFDHTICFEDYDDLLAQLKQFLQKQLPDFEKKTILAGTSCDLHHAQFDIEDDPLHVISFTATHDATVFDNTAHCSPIDLSDALSYRWDHAGKYEIEKIIGDQPPTPKDAKESNLACATLWVHRKPIAQLSIDACYDPIQNQYHLSYNDSSFDLDHQYSHPQKGIIAHRMKYRGEQDWIYTMPDTLPRGIYEFHYMVQDIEHTWSNVQVISMDLSQKQSVALKANLSPNTIAAGASMRLHDISSSYVADHAVEVLTTPKKMLQLQSQKAFNYYWNDECITTKPTDPDGKRQMIIRAVDTKGNELQRLHLPYTISTPIHVKGKVTSTECSATTSPYASTCDVILYKGTPFEERRTLSKIQAKLWKTSLPENEHIPSGTYHFEFIAHTSNGNVARHTVIHKVDALTITEFSMTGKWNRWDNQPHRFLGYEKIIIHVKVKGNPDSVSVRFSPELEAMTYTNHIGHTYDYQKEIGDKVSFPLLLSKVGEHQYEASYILPLAHSTLSIENQRLKSPYEAIVTIKKSAQTKTMSIKDIDITGNIHDFMEYQPVDLK